MRWFCLRKANIDPELRETFERYGVVSMQITLSTTNYFWHKGKTVAADTAVAQLLPWLTEQYDRAERRETWSITMEAAITVLVAVEAVPVVVSLVCSHLR
jgi:hypothetical protein